MSSVCRAIFLCLVGALLTSAFATEDFYEFTKQKFDASCYDTSQGDFAGSEVYSLAAELENHVSWYENTKIRLDSWGNKRQEESSIMSPLQVEGAKETLKQLIPSLNNLRKKSEDVLSKYFFESAVKEWIKDKIDIYIDLADQLARRTEKITKQLEVDR